MYNHSASILQRRQVTVGRKSYSYYGLYIFRYIRLAAGGGLAATDKVRRIDDLCQACRCALKSMLILIPVVHVILTSVPA